MFCFDSFCVWRSLWALDPGWFSGSRTSMERLTLMISSGVVIFFTNCCCFIWTSDWLSSFCLLISLSVCLFVCSLFQLLRFYCQFLLVYIYLSNLDTAVIILFVSLWEMLASSFPVGLKNTQLETNYAALGCLHVRYN